VFGCKNTSSRKTHTPALKHSELLNVSSDTCCYQLMSVESRLTVTVIVSHSVYNQLKSRYQTALIQLC